LRTSLGAGRERLVRQLLTESLVLAGLGGLAGVAAAYAALPLLMRLVPLSLPIAQPSIDPRVLVFAALATAATGLGFGVLPAVRVSRLATAGNLREAFDERGGGRKQRLRAALVVAEVAASVVLLASTGLLIRALWRLQGVDPGFRAEGVVTLRTALPVPKYERTARREQFYAQVLSQVRALPGVSEAAYISFLPMVMRGGIWPVSVGGQPRSRTESNTASLRFVTPQFFATMRIPLRAGRDVSESDTDEGLQAAVVSESFVRRYWPGQNPLGRQFQFAFRERTIVGVVGDIKVRGLEMRSEPQVYLPYKQVPDGGLWFYAPKDLAIRAGGDAGALLPAVRRIIRSADPEQPVSNARLLEEIVEADTAPRRLQVRVLGAFAAIAFLLAGLGIHGLVSFAVSQRTQEIGVRVALGARPGDVFAMVLRNGVFLTAAGVAIGLSLALAVGRTMEGLLAGIKPWDAVALTAAAGAAAVLGIVSACAPAWRAVSIDPIQAIRAE
jgi:predicted permease